MVTRPLTRSKSPRSKRTNTSTYTMATARTVRVTPAPINNIVYNEMKSWISDWKDTSNREALTEFNKDERTLILKNSTNTDAGITQARWYIPASVFINVPMREFIVTFPNHSNEDADDIKQMSVGYYQDMNNFVMVQQQGRNAVVAMSQGVKITYLFTLSQAQPRVSQTFAVHFKINNGGRVQLFLNGKELTQMNVVLNVSLCYAVVEWNVGMESPLSLSFPSNNQSLPTTGFELHPTDTTCLQDTRLQYKLDKCVDQSKRVAKTALHDRVALKKCGKLNTTLKQQLAEQQGVEKCDEKACAAHCPHVPTQQEADSACLTKQTFLEELHKKQLAEKDAKIVEKEAEIAEKVAELAEKEAQATKKEAELAEKDAELAEKDAKLAEKDKELSALKETISTLQSKVTAPDTSLFGQLGNQSGNDSHISDDTNNDCLGQLQLCNMEKQNMSEQYEKLQKFSKACERNLEQVKALHDNIQHQYKVIQEAVLPQLQTCESEKAHVKELLKEVKNSNLSQASNLEQLRTELKSLTESYTALQEQNQIATNEKLENAEAKIGRLQDSLRNKNEIQERKCQEQIEFAVEDLKLKVLEKQNVNDILEGSINNIQRQLENKNRELQSCTQEFELFKETNPNNETKYTNILKEKESLEIDISRLANELEDKTEKITRANATIDEMKQLTVNFLRNILPVNQQSIMDRTNMEDTPITLLQLAIQKATAKLQSINCSECELELEASLVKNAASTVELNDIYNLIFKQIVLFGNSEDFDDEIRLRIQTIDHKTMTTISLFNIYTTIITYKLKGIYNVLQNEGIFINNPENDESFNYFTFAFVQPLTSFFDSIRQHVSNSD